MTLFPDNSSYSFHQMRLTLGRQLDYDVVQRIMYQIITILKDSSDMTWFLDVSGCYAIGGQDAPRVTTNLFKLLFGQCLSVLLLRRF